RYARPKGDRPPPASGAVREIGVDPTQPGFKPVVSHPTCLAGPPILSRSIILTTRSGGFARSSEWAWSPSRVSLTMVQNWITGFRHTAWIKRAAITERRPGVEVAGTLERA